MDNDSDSALHEQREWLRVTLASIGDAVITTDTGCNVAFLNPVADCQAQSRLPGVSRASVPTRH
jgi:hypothetical protein